MGQAPVAAPGGSKPGNEKKFRAKPKAPNFMEANKPEPLEASVANQEKPSSAATIGASSDSKLGPPKGIEDSIWAPSSSTLKAAAKSIPVPVAPRPVSAQPVAPRLLSSQPVASKPALAPALQAVETKPKDGFSLSNMAMALPLLQPTGQGRGSNTEGSCIPSHPISRLIVRIAKRPGAWLYRDCLYPHMERHSELSSQGKWILSSLSWVPTVRTPDLTTPVLKWVGASPTRAQDVAFGHIQGPAAFGKSLNFPNRIWLALASSGSTNISVVHVVSRCNVPILSAHRAQSVSVAVARGHIPLMTLDYQQFLSLLKQSRQNGSWHVSPMGPLNPRTFFIIDVDKDFSAPFYLALYAAIEFSHSITEEQPQALMRLATISSDPIDVLYYRLLSLSDTYFTGFTSTVPKSEPWHRVAVGRREDPFKAIISIQGQLNPDLQQTVVYFHDTPGLPPRWKEDGWEASGWSSEQFHLDRHGNFPVDSEPETGHTMFNVPCGTRGYGKLQVSGYLHIILSKTRQRPIFDLETRQVVHVDLYASQSEIRQQLSWVDRTTCPRSRVYVYADTAMNPEIEHPRRKDVLNHQLAGFIAGLAQFEGWPSRVRSLPRLVTLLAHEDGSTRGVVNQTVQRLELQGLLRTEDSEIGPAISLHDSIPNTFHALLPLVDYDTRLAYLLVQPSDPMTNCLKIQVAAMLTIGQDKMVSFQRGLLTPEDRLYTEIAMKTGYGANLTHLGTPWMVLGLVKRGKFEVVYRDDSRPFVDGKVSLGHVACQEWEKRCIAIHKILSPGQPRVDILDEIGTLTEDQVEVLHWDFLRAFTFQIGVVNHPGDGRFPTVHDFVSRAELAFESAAIMIDFDAIKKNDPECMVGFYTTLFRTKDQPETLTTDWNWIPSFVWRRWREHLEADGSDRWASLTNKYDLGPNSDEFKND